MILVLYPRAVIDVSVFTRIVFLAKCVSCAKHTTKNTLSQLQLYEQK